MNNITDTESSWTLTKLTVKVFQIYFDRDFKVKFPDFNLKS